MVQQNADALDRAIARAELAVVWLRGTEKLRATLGWSTERGCDPVRDAELRARRLQDLRALLAVSQGRRRVIF